MQFVVKRVADREPQELWAKHSANQLHSYFTWAFQYLAENSVDKFKNDTLRDGLINQFSEVLPDPNDASLDHKRLADHPYSAVFEPPNSEPKSSDESGCQAATSAGRNDSNATTEDHESRPNTKNSNSESGSDSSGGAVSEGKSGRRKDLKPEKNLYSGVRVPNLSGNIQRLLKEVRLQSVDDSYAIACVLARVILELCVSDPKVLAWTGKAENDKLVDKINACIFKIDPNIDAPAARTRQDLVQARLEAQGIGVKYLHQFMHNPSARADPQLARRFSSAFTPLLNSIDDAVE